MTTYPHALTECEKCGVHYCMGCVGEDCPNCQLQETGFYAIELEGKLEAVTKWFTENGAFHCDVHDLIGLRKILEAEE